ncbi:phosphopantetheine-binding protein [Oleiagrimonas sp. C23AA]|uniref:acyl carrier protein n=1 Tax=Oleiagrimonas sp. C23AA TaxID=2719047 RepID=UPI0014229BC8|nr:phosphopantetheine-binding protein [Oleiagrimonas sp. C23AA]NII11125.1 acyl carrier protein [Oleiagrimonas sp. C23AA]
MNASVQQQIFQIIAEHGKIEASTITPDSTLTDLGIASLEAIEIIFDIEEHFDITLPDNNPDFDTGSTQGLIDAVQDAIALKAAAETEAEAERRSS